MAIYRCKICNYIYEEEEKGVNFEELDDNYHCPKCRASKNRFERKELPK
ncbi:MAG: rubredoxin [Candidatus Lokiarchaeota archaeon]|nr:rubredoxin [Candidatus Lokiarchaeota archaeon]